MKTILASTFFMILISNAALAVGEIPAIKHVFVQAELSRNEKKTIASEQNGQSVLITIKSKELNFNGEKGTELWIKVISTYQGKKVKCKRHRVMFGASGYEEHIVLHHINKTKQQEKFQINLDIQLPPIAKPNLSV